MADATPYDFTAPRATPPVVAELLTTLTDATPRFGVALSVVSRRDVSAACSGVRLMPFGDVPREGATALRFGALGDDAARLVVPDPLFVALADLFMNGPGRPAERAPSDIEKALVRRHLPDAMRPLTAVAGIGMPGEEVVIESFDPTLRAGYVLVSSLDITIGDAAPQTALLVLPARAEQVEASPRVTTVSSAAVTRALAQVPVTVSLRLASITAHAADMALLSPGDVIRLEGRTASSVVGSVDDVPVLRAHLGRRGPRLAMLIDDVAGGVA